MSSQDLWGPQKFLRVLQETSKSTVGNLIHYWNPVIPTFSPAKKMPFQRWDHSRKSTRWRKDFRSQSSQFIQTFTATVGMWCHPIDSSESSGYYMPNPSWNLGIRVALSPLISLYLCLCDVGHHHTLHSSRWQASRGEAAVLPCLIIVKPFPATLLCPGEGLLSFQSSSTLGSSLFACLGSPRRPHSTPELSVHCTYLPSSPSTLFLGWVVTSTRICTTGEKARK